LPSTTAFACRCIPCGAPRPSPILLGQDAAPGAGPGRPGPSLACATESLRLPCFSGVAPNFVAQLTPCDCAPSACTDFARTVTRPRQKIAGGWLPQPRGVETACSRPFIPIFRFSSSRPVLCSLASRHGPVHAVTPASALSRHERVPPTFRWCPSLIPRSLRLSCRPACRFFRFFVAHAIF
jgi:hypothetical protein